MIKVFLLSVFLFTQLAIGSGITIQGGGGDLKADGTVPMSGDLDMGSNKVLTATDFQTSEGGTVTILATSGSTADNQFRIFSNGNMILENIGSGQPTYAQMQAADSDNTDDLYWGMCGTGDLSGFPGNAECAYLFYDSFQGSPEYAVGTQKSSGSGTLRDFRIERGYNNSDMKLTSAGVEYSSTILAENGTAALPSISFKSDPNSGIFRQGDNDISLVTNAVARLRITATDVNVAGARFMTGHNGVNITSDNQGVSPVRSVLVLDSDSVTATDRTFTLGDGGIGQVLTLVFSDGSGAVELIDDDTQFCGSADWLPTDRDTLDLVWVNGPNCWFEKSRSVN